MAHQKAAIRMTLSDLEGHLPTACLSKCNFFRTAVQKLTRFQLTVRCVVSL